MLTRGKKVIGSIKLFFYSLDSFFCHVSVFLGTYCSATNKQYDLGKLFNCSGLQFSVCKTDSNSTTSHRVVVEVKWSNLWKVLACIVSILKWVFYYSGLSPAAFLTLTFIQFPECTELLPTSRPPWRLFSLLGWQSVSDWLLLSSRLPTTWAVPGQHAVCLAQ